MQKDQHDIIIIRGAPGVGKTTLAKPLKHLYSEGVTIEVDTIRGMIHNVKWMDKNEHTASLKAALAMSEQYLLSGYDPIIMVDTLGYSRMKQFVTMLQKAMINGRHIKYFTFSLFCDQEVLIKRITNRPDGFKNLEASITINHEMKKPNFPPEMLIDTTNMKPLEVYEAVTNELGIQPTEQ